MEGSEAFTGALASDTHLPAGNRTSSGSGGRYDENYTYAAGTGTLAKKAGVTYGYNDANHEHAVTHTGGVQRYWYDANGNQTKRVLGADTYDLSDDGENRLTQVKKNGAMVASFVYDGAGQRVKATASGVTTAYIGSHYEYVLGSGTVRTYHAAGDQRVMGKPRYGTSFED